MGQPVGQFARTRPTDSRSHAALPGESRTGEIIARSGEDHVSQVVSR